MKKRTIVLVILGIIFAVRQKEVLQAKTLHVGTGQTYSTPVAAATAAFPGDTILLHAGTYAGGYYISNLLGTPAAWIVLMGENKNSVIIQGSTEGLHLSHIEYVKIQNLTFTAQTGNGMNIDDNGNTSTPSKNFIVHNCGFRYMAATGNNDFLKLSGLDSFEVTNCTFLKGSAGGSGIDMVGCHYGNFRNNTFDSLGSNCIQAKGGTQFLRIENNTFRDGGQRAVNLGGSTGLQFFRPIDAKFEAANIEVYANVFIRGIVPIAYVGSENVIVANNTIYFPEKWVIRILQETVDTSRFVPCRNGYFANNIIYYSNAVTTHVNIGPNTAPETFLFTHNLWYNSSSPTNSTPSLPTTEISGIHGQDPLFISSTDFRLTSASPAIYSGFNNASLGLDMQGHNFKNPPSRGAYEYNSSATVHGSGSLLTLKVYPNPSGGKFTIESTEPGNFKIFDLYGSVILSGKVNGAITLQLPATGLYLINYSSGKQVITSKILID